MLRVQTSIQGRAVPIGAGQNRLSGNLTDWMDFKAVKTKAAGGKGGAVGAVFGKGGGTGYNYYVSAVVSLGEGPISSIDTIYNGNSIYFLSTPSVEILADLAALGITPSYGLSGLPISFFLGGYTQSPWGYLTTFHSDHALAYRGEALACFANTGLGSSPTFPSYSWEITWGLNTSAGSPTKDVNPADWFTAFLSNPDWGVPGFPSSLLGDFSAFAAYCRAYDLFISPVLTDATAGQSHLAEIMKALAADFKWSQGKLTAAPFSSEPATGNGVTFTPPTFPIYNLTVNDFLPNQGSLGSGGSEPTSISVARKNPSQAVNTVRVEYFDRGNIYNPVTIYQADDATIVATGRAILSDLRSHHFFCTSEAAVQSCALQLAREKVLTQYQFTLGSMYALLEVFDVVALSEPAIGFAGQLVRIVEIQENSDQSLTFTADELLGPVGAVGYPTQQPIGTGVNELEDPGAINTPIIFEPPNILANNQVWLAVSGVNIAAFGGVFVWISTDGGGTYGVVGAQVGPARQGTLTTVLPTIAPAGTPTPDNGNTLSVDLTESAGLLASGTAADMNALVTLCYVDGELVAHETANLTSAFHFNLSPLLRGCYGTPIASHAIGSQFVRLDSSIFKYAYDPGLIGRTVYIKLQPFNIYQLGAPDLSTLTPIVYTIRGTIPAPPPRIHSPRPTARPRFR
jgi:hypothetical protein